MMRGNMDGQSRSPSDTDSAVLLRYYSERDHLTSPEGIMKVISVMLCIVLSVALFSTSCAATPVRAAGAALELACAATLACLYAARLLQLVTYAPMGCFYADLVLSTVIGVVLLVTAALGLALCGVLRVADYIHGPLGITTAGLVMGSAVVTYVLVTRRWDAAQRPVAVAGRPSSPEQEV